MVTNCNRLKLIAEDGKPRFTDVADMATMFRVIESIPSKKAEPIKVWMSQVAAERINQAIDPERSIDQAVADYRRLGYSESWINQRGSKNGQFHVHNQINSLRVKTVVKNRARCHFIRALPHR